MPIFNPLAFPYEPVATYADGGAAVTSGDFYNPVQDVIAALFGGMAGISFSLRNEDFDYNAGAVTGASQPFGQQLWISTNTAFTVQPTTTGLAAGDHGVWQVLQTAATNGTFIADEGLCYIGLRDFIVTSKVQIVRLAGLDAVANAGFAVGLNDPLGSAPHFRAGSDAANWQAYYTTPTDTGVAITNGKWYWLIVAKRSGVVRWYIKPAGGALTQVASAGVGALAGCSRIVRCKTTGGAANDGFFIDVIARVLQR